MPEAALRPLPEKLLLLCRDGGLREQARAVLGTAVPVLEAADMDSARACLEREAPDVVIVEAAAAAELLSAISQQDYPPPVIALGAAAAPPDIFAHARSPDDLPAWASAASRYRRLQLETKLVREESERVHTGLLTSYGAVSEHSHQLEEEVKRRTEELRQHAQDLERLVEQRTE